jgi:molybdate transport system regulatory protein
MNKKNSKRPDKNRRKDEIIVKARLFLSTKSGKGVFGGGKWELLSAVEKCGSLYKASRCLKRSYRKAWDDINTAEQRLGFALVTRSRGGAAGGTMLLTRQGRQFLRAWERFSGSVMKRVDKSYEKYILNVINK